MSDFTNSYFTKITHRTNIAPNRLIIGDFIIFDYPHRNTKRPIVMVLNKNYEKLLHGILINYIPLAKLIQMIDLLTPKTIKPNSFLRKFVTKLLTESKAQKSFYAVKVKPTLKKIQIPEGSPYRTYTLTEMRNIRKVNLIL